MQSNNPLEEAAVPLISDGQQNVNHSIFDVPPHGRYDEFGERLATIITVPEVLGAIGRAQQQFPNCPWAHTHTRTRLYKHRGIEIHALKKYNR